MVEGKIGRRYSNGDGLKLGTVSIRMVGLSPRDPIITPATLTLLGTQNPQLVGPENKVLRVVLGWNPLHGLGLATSK